MKHNDHMNGNALSNFHFGIDESLAMKGIAIFIMIFLHCFSTASRILDYPGVVDFSPFSESFVVNNCRIFKICVPIYAFLSGYGLYLSAKSTISDPLSIKKWSITRFIKTFNGFWFVYIFVFIITLIYNQYPQQVYFSKGITYGVFYMIIDFMGLAELFSTPMMDNVWWYMTPAIIFIFLIPFFVRVKKNYGFIPIIILVIFIPRLLIFNEFDSTTTYPFIFSLLLGAIFAEYRLFEKIDQLKIVKDNTLNKIMFFIIWLAILIVSSVIYMKAPITKVWEYNYGIYPVIFIIFFTKYFNRIPVIKNILIFFGKHSMNVFLIHHFIVHTFFTEFIYSFKYFWLIPIVLFAISLALSFLIIEPLKKLVHWNKLMNLLTERISNRMDKKLLNKTVL